MAPGAGMVTGRDLRIDFFRGIALVMIFVNHIPGNPLSFFTQRSWGFSDSAEVFVLLAGVASALAYSKFFDRGAAGAGAFAILSRIWSLYIMHLMLFLVVAALCVLGAERLNETSYLETLGFDVFLQAPAGFIVNVLTLSFLPGYLDILPLYIVLLSMVPVLMLLSRRHWALPLAASLVLYAVAHAFPINLPNTRTAHVWFFNPFAWQLLFVIGFTLGRQMLQPGGLSLGFGQTTRRAITTLAALFTLAAVVIVAPWRELPGYENVILVNPASLGTFSKTDLPLVRLTDILAKLWLVTVLVDSGARWLRGALARIFINMGRHSLEVFALSTVASVAGGILATVYGFQPWLVAAINGTGFVAMATLGALLEWRKAATASLAAQSQRGALAVDPAR